MATKRTDTNADILALLAPPIIGGTIRGKLTLDAGSTATDNEHGIDTLTRPFFGFTDEIYKLAPRRGQRDKWLPNMICTDRQFVEGRGRTARVNVTYKGLIDDKIPDIVIRGGWTEQTVQLGVTTSQGPASEGIYFINPNVANFVRPAFDQNAEVSVTYRAPQTTFMYVVRRQPSGPRFNGQILVPDGDFSIIDMRPARIAGRPTAYISVRPTSFNIEPAGQYWQCTEIQQGLLIAVDASDLNVNGAQTIGSPFPVNRAAKR